MNSKPAQAGLLRSHFSPNSIRKQLVEGRAVAYPMGDAGHETPFPRKDGSPRGEITPAGVLIALVNRGNDVNVVFTQRTDHLSDHAGQISFPGGRAEAADAGIIDTALREAEEEIGLPRHRVEVLGTLPDYHTITGYRVTPVVGWVEPPINFKPDPFEVADVFEVPLLFLLDAANHQRHSLVREGLERFYYAMPYNGRYIWGATAGMLVTLQRVLVKSD
jgi:8-oxo-dGTP pyrophosphatase MutT (NUDIX family)